MTRHDSMDPTTFAHGMAATSLILGYNPEDEGRGPTLRRLGSLR